MLKSCDSCLYKKYCLDNTQYIISHKDFVYFGRLVTMLNYKNLKFMLYQIYQGYRNGIFDFDIPTLQALKNWKRRVYGVFGDNFDYIVDYSYKNNFSLEVRKKGDDVLHDFYPKCCVDFYHTKRWYNYKMSDYIVECYSNSKFVCSLLNYSIFFINESARDSPIFPYYKIHSLDCVHSIVYAKRALAFFQHIDLKKLFLYFKCPVIFIKNKPFVFRGYYYKGVIYYKDVYFENNKKVIRLKRKLSFNVVPCNCIKIIPGHYIEEGIIYLKYISK